MPSRYAIFCADPLNPGAIEPAYQREAEEAHAAGFTIARLDHDFLDRRIDAAAALRKSRFDEPGRAIYRGWMMSGPAYAALHGELQARSIELQTDPAQYDACHHAPGSYHQLARWMPRTVWVEIASMDVDGAIDDALAPFGNGAVVLKDWVKSQAAGYWHEACFIADASNTEAVHLTVKRFRALQGDSLTGGLVFKQYIPLMPVGSPALEYRAFIVNCKIAGCWPRSEEAKALGSPPADLLDQVAACVPSPFASADFGRDEEGQWWLLEVGDGQVSGLPDASAATPIFQALAR